LRRMNERSKAIINFINEFGATDSLQIQNIFFQTSIKGEPIAYGDQRAQRVLKSLWEKKFIRRTEKEDPITARYIYYVGNRSQLRHKLLITEFYTRLLCGPGKIREFDCHFSFENIRPDAYVVYVYQGKCFIMWLEVQISSNPLNLQKYIKLKESGAWEEKTKLEFPDLVVVSDRNFKEDSRLKMFVIGTDYRDWERILKDPG
jgi:hypothetical protein